MVRFSLMFAVAGFVAISAFPIFATTIYFPADQPTIFGPDWYEICCAIVSSDLDLFGHT